MPPTALPTITPIGRAVLLESGVLVEEAASTTVEEAVVEAVTE